MRGWQLRTRKQRTAAIDMHSFLQLENVVIHSQVVVMSGDVVSCSLPVTACSYFAERHVVCRHIQIMGCGMPSFYDASGDVAT